MASESRVEIISRQNVKPSIATPPKLKMYKLSIFDQLVVDHMYMGCVMFYLNPIPSSPETPSMAMLLKKSLSTTLAHFYPLAGEVSRDGLHIECNDNGVLYVEARVREHLSDFLSRPYSDEGVAEFLPFHPRSPELKVQTYMCMVQVNTFTCGGIGIGFYTCHKVVDGQTVALFLRAWAAQAANRPKVIPDLYTASTLFQQDPELSKKVNTSALLFDQKTMKRVNKKAVRRFVFSAAGLAALKAKTGAPSRALAVAGLIWKCAASASPNPSVFTSPVSLRTAFAAHGLAVAPNSIGNLFWFSEVRSIPDATLEVVIRSIRDGIAAVNGEDFVQLMTGEKGTENISRLMAEWRSKFVAGDRGQLDYYACSIVCNTGIYEVDFGWGKPIWAAHGGSSAEMAGCLILLGDTRSGGGIEAIVTLDEPKMEMLEKHPDILQFAALDPSHLQTDSPLPLPRPRL